MAVHTRQYEAMFLLNAGYASGNWEAAKSEVEHILHRANAEILHLRKWDERRLTYPIKGNKRGTYVLAFFRCEGPKVAGIERDVLLSENILRVLVIKAEHLTLKDIENMTPQQPIAEDHSGRLHRRSGPERNATEPDAIEEIPVNIADVK
ncbi:MAG TPA: 30S ribosomal protein S6 [Phycisphaerae bacterium]|nr:30S ribosomal protein S6 [Phycisphaerae bacterium]